MRPLAHIVPGALLHLLRDTPTSDGKIAFAWSAAVGPALARVTRVKLEHDTLIVEATSAQWAREVNRSSPIILRKLHALVGPERIARILVRDLP